MRRDEVEEKLRSLGDTPDAIAGALRDAGIRGERRRCHTCPLARWFEQLTGEPTVVVGWFAFVGTAEYPLPAAAQDFVALFDTGRYDELCEEVRHEGA